jgi:peptidoglycan/LPS O-acetylase OafA/YrhL
VGHRAGDVSAGWLAAVLVALVLILRNKVNGGSTQVQTGWAFAVEGWVYLAVLVLTLTFVDASPIFEHRILSPFYICVLVLGAAALAWVWQQKPPYGRVIAAVFALGLLVSFAEDSMDSIHLLHQDGQGFAKSDWLESPTIAAVSQLPETQIYTNRNTAVYI